MRSTVRGMLAAVGLLAALGLGPVAAPAGAAVDMPAVFNDHMVLQRGRPTPVWGRAEPGEKITVSIADASVSAEANDAGRWRVQLPAMTAGGPYGLRIDGGQSDPVRFQNVMVGEVWVCSGQSNMQWTVARAKNAKKEIANAHHSRIRLFHVPRKVTGEPQPDVDAKWEICKGNTVRNFSAVAYFFGRKLHDELDVPIGLIHTSYGGSTAEAWISRPTLESEPSLKPLLKRWDQRIANYNPDKKKGRDPRRSQHRPAGLYNAMLHPIIPYAMRGVIWYQGESNASRAYQYRTIFPMLIREWRNKYNAAWQLEDRVNFPFYFVQLANYKAGQDPPHQSDWAELREAQLMTHRKLPNTGMAVTIDIGNPNNIHPKNKQDVGRRLARWALAKDYGRDIVYSGPLHVSADFHQRRVTLHFEHVGEGLKAKGGSLKGFEIAGSDREFHPAKAKIVDEDTIRVYNKQTRGFNDPVAVRYGWEDNPEQCNLYNSAGLPASPFRTDDWPGITKDRD